MRHHPRARLLRRSSAGRYVALLPLAAVAVAAYLARNHHPVTTTAAGRPASQTETTTDSGPELAAFSIEDYEPVQADIP